MKKNKNKKKKKQKKKNSEKKVTGVWHLRHYLFGTTIVCLGVQHAHCTHERVAQSDITNE